MHNGVSGIAGSVQYLDGGHLAADLVGKLSSVHAAREYHVGEEEVDGGLFIEEPERRRAVARLEHAIAEFFQHLYARRADFLLVFYDKNGLAAGGRGMRFGCRRVIICGGTLDQRARQIHLYGRALTRFAVDLGVSAGLFDETVHLA